MHQIDRRRMQVDDLYRSPNGTLELPFEPERLSIERWRRGLRVENGNVDVAVRPPCPASKAPEKIRGNDPVLLRLEDRA